MTRAHLFTVILAGGLALATLGAAMPNDGPHGDGQAYCPAPRPGPRPAHHRHGLCPARAREAGNHGWRRHARFGGAERGYDREDGGVSASQAWVYRRELAEHGLNGPGRERRDYDVRPRGGGDGYRAAESWRDDRQGGGWRGSPPDGPGWDRGHGDRDAELSGGHYRYERREFDDRGGYVEGSHDGRRYGWSWRGDGDRSDDRADGGWADRDRDGDHGRDSQWRYGQGGGYEVYRYAGRDEDGYLVWPGKSR